jgi:hypothetical protein
MLYANVPIHSKATPHPDLLACGDTRHRAEQSCPCRSMKPRQKAAANKPECLLHCACRNKDHGGPSGGSRMDWGPPPPSPSSNDAPKARLCTAKIPCFDMPSLDSAVHRSRFLAISLSCHLLLASVSVRTRSWVHAAGVQDSKTIPASPQRTHANFETFHVWQFWICSAPQDSAT